MHVLRLSRLRTAAAALLLNALHPLLQVLHGHLQLGATDDRGGRVLHGGRVVVRRRGRVAATVRRLIADGAEAGLSFEVSSLMGVVFASIFHN